MRKATVKKSAPTRATRSTKTRGKQTRKPAVETAPETPLAPETEVTTKFEEVEGQSNVLTRALRSADTRAKKTRRKSWKPPSMLDAPDPPEGYHHRWIRAEMANNPDKLNMSKRMREGFELVRGREYPDFEAPTSDEGRHAGVISVGGMLLARIPIETVEERRNYYRNRTAAQMQAIDNELMANSNPTMPILAPSRKSTREFGNPENTGGEE